MIAYLAAWVFWASKMGMVFQNLASGCPVIWMDNTLQYGPPYCSRCMPLSTVAYTYLMYVHFYHSLCRTISSYNPFFYVLLCHTSNKVTVLLVLKLHSFLFSNFLVVVLASCMFLLFVLFCLSSVFLEFSAGSYVPSVALSPQTAVAVFSRIPSQVVLPCFLPEFSLSVCFFHYTIQLSRVFPFFFVLQLLHQFFV